MSRYLLDNSADSIVVVRSSSVPCITETAILLTLAGLGFLAGTMFSNAYSKNYPVVSDLALAFRYVVIVVAATTYAGMVIKNRSAAKRPILSYDIQNKILVFIHKNTQKQLLQTGVTIDISSAFRGEISSREHFVQVAVIDHGSCDNGKQGAPSNVMVIKEDPRWSRSSLISVITKFSAATGIPYSIDQLKPETLERH